MTPSVLRYKKKILALILQDMEEEVSSKSIVPLQVIQKKKFAGQLDQLQKPKGFIGPVPF